MEKGVLSGRKGTVFFFGPKITRERLGEGGGGGRCSRASSQVTVMNSRAGSLI